jgi:hypothetical protein
MEDINAHIPTEEILKDIKNTEAEINQMLREVEGFRLVGDRMSQFRADNRINRIKERYIFITKLEKILNLRGIKIPE